MLKAFRSRNFLSISTKILTENFLSFSKKFLKESGKMLSPRFLHQHLIIEKSSDQVLEVLLEGLSKIDVLHLLNLLLCLKPCQTFTVVLFAKMVKGL